MKKSIFVVSIVIVVSLLVLQATPVVACHCEESVNPHGNIIPGNDRPIDVGNISVRPHNPDGFTTIVGSWAWVGQPIVVYYGDEYDKLHWRYDLGLMVDPYDFALVVKWTQVPGSDYILKDIGSGSGNGGQADEVDVHFIVPGEPWCTVYVNGVLAWEGSCLVPPPPM